MALSSRQVIEGKKRAKEEDALRREEERALRDSLGGGAPSGLPADLLVRPVLGIQGLFFLKAEDLALSFVLLMWLLVGKACPKAATPVPQHADIGCRVLLTPLRVVWMRPGVQGRP